MSTTEGTPTEAQRFSSLLSPLLDSAFGMALHLTRNRADAEDLVQEAALQAFRGLRSFAEGTNFKAWFFRILTNCFYYRHRRQKREPEVVDVEDAAELYMIHRALENGLLGDTDDPAGRVLDKIGEEHVAEAIAALPAEFRVVCALYFMEDLRYQEIAEILDCPVGTVRSRLHRGRRLLQKLLWRVAHERGVAIPEGVDTE